MFDFLRDFFGRLFGGESDEEDFIGVEGITDGQGEGIEFEIESLEEGSLVWDYWIDEPVGDLVTSGGHFFSVDDAVNYVEGAPYGVLWIYIDPENGLITVYRNYEG